MVIRKWKKMTKPRHAKPTEKKPTTDDEPQLRCTQVDASSQGMASTAVRRRTGENDRDGRDYLPQKKPTTKLPIVT